MGAQDIDMILRLRADGGCFKRSRFRSQAIPNNQEANIANVCPKLRVKWTAMNVWNQELFAARRAAGELVRNAARRGGGVITERKSQPVTLFIK